MLQNLASSCNYLTTFVLDLHLRHLNIELWVQMSTHCGHQVWKFAEKAAYRRGEIVRKNSTVDQQNEEAEDLVDMLQLLRVAVNNYAGLEGIIHIMFPKYIH